MLVHTELLGTDVPIGCSMHNLLRCRRGSAAFATVAALVPLIGVVALGGEAGSWYVTKQHAQNAADAAAMAGGWRLKGSIIAQIYVNSPRNHTNSVGYPRKQFSAPNAFCHAGDAHLSRFPWTGP